MADLKQVSETFAELDRAIALVLTTPADAVVDCLIADLCEAGINIARGQALATSRRGKSRYHGDLLHVLDALDEALDMLDAARNAT